jgi:hypothetical protein
LSVTSGAAATASLVVTSDVSKPSLNNPIFVTAGDGTDAQLQMLGVDGVLLGIWSLDPSLFLWDASPWTTTAAGFFFLAVGDTRCPVPAYRQGPNATSMKHWDQT